MSGRSLLNNSKEQIFKVCPMCEKRRESRNTFLDDRELFFNGYQANFGNIEEGLFYFTHDTAECGSTMVIKALTFLPLYSGLGTGIKSAIEAGNVKADRLGCSRWHCGE